MSVYIARRKDGSAKSPYWQFDFERSGHRFSGSFDGEDGRPEVRIEQPQADAEREEAVIRSAAATGQHELKRMTLHDAAAHYWSHEAKFQAAADSIWGYLGHLERLLGKKTYIDDITDAKLVTYVARRRSETARRRKNLISNSTLNRDLETLQFIFRSVRKIARLPKEMPDIGSHKLPEKKRVRALTSDEDQRLFASIDKLRPDFRDFVEFALISLKRLSEVIFLEKRNVDFRAMTARVIAKGGREIVIALTEYSAAILKRNWMNHPTRVFTYVCQRSGARRLRDGTVVHFRKGRRYGFTVDGWREPWKAILDDAEITDFRFHDLRHTGATRVLEATGNLKAAQEALDHQDIRSTTRYAHMFTAQKRQALQAAERLRERPAPENPQNGESKTKNSADGTGG